MSSIDTNSQQFISYIKYFGPSVDGGKIDVEKVGISLVALNKIFKKYAKKKGQKEFSLKLQKVQKNCTEIIISLEPVVQVMQTAANTTTVYIAFKALGLEELGKQFFGTLGQQISLTLFSKGQKLLKKKELAEDGKALVLAQNVHGEEKKFEKDIYESRTDYATHLNDFVQLEGGKEEKMKVGYYQSDIAQDVAEIGYTEKEYFQPVENEKSLEERLEEEFDESNAEERLIVGKFIDYYGMAKKYHFSFQARKNIEQIGKQKILCKLKNIEISEIIDLLKPENQKKNICIFGKATKDQEGKIDKISIEWFNTDENFNPDQTKIFD